MIAGNVGTAGAVLRIKEVELTERDTRVAATPFADVYEAHAPAVYRYCLSQLGDPAAAEDAAAEAFSNAYVAWPGLTEDDPARVRRWIFRIAHNTAIDQHRRRQRRVRLLGRLGRNGHGAVDVETVAALRAELRAALDAVAGLGRRDRELAGLRVAAGLSYAEIASLLGTTEQAARTATHRALVRVRTVLEG